jgi:glycosyltransferase involved in cell wall biosynthesis
MQISCICPTYNRAPDHLFLVEEAIESFVRQDWPNKQLIVVNDTPGQELVCDVWGVRVLNERKRIDSLGEKYNIAIEASIGDLICPWEDDDINLPWRLTECVQRLGEADYYNPHRYWFMDGGGLCHSHAMGVSHACGIFRRSAWQTVGGYPEISGAQDAEMDRKLRQQCTLSDALAPDIDRWWYIYRWGVSPVHLSGNIDHQAQYERIGERPVELNRFELRPHWRQDYVKLCSDIVKGQRSCLSQ